VEWIENLKTKTSATATSTKKIRYLQKKDDIGERFSKGKKLFHDLCGDIKGQVSYDLQEPSIKFP